MIFKGRYTAQVSEPFVVFLIGMRVNKIRSFRKWWWVAMAMPKMLRRLAQVPELGLLHAEQFTRGRTTLMVQYWRSFERLEAFAKDQESPHLAAWRKWNKQMRAAGDDVGFWHETYTVQPGSAEAVYVNMPIFGLAKAASHVPVAAVGDRAAQRLRAGARVS
jgi:Monooxygenase af470-like